MRVLLLVAKLQVVTCVVCAVAAADGPTRVAPPEVLLNRYAPIVVLHPDEQFQPVAVDGFLADSDVTRQSAAGWTAIGEPLPVGGADLRLDQRLCAAIDGPAATPCYAAAQEAHGTSPVIYGAVFRTKTRIDLQYWLWYPYDDYVSARQPAGDVWQVHEGDWESVSVILDRAGRPLTVALSAHCEGTRRAWSGVRRKATHPVVYVALGSHANYFGAGVHPHDPVCWPLETRDVVRALQLADRTATGRTIRPSVVRVTATRPSWMEFAGAWGETGYLHFPNNAPVAYGAGPRGPAFHRQWRRPVVEAMSWPPG